MTFDLNVILIIVAVLAVLILAFLAWFLSRSLAAWRASFEGSGLARAGSVIIFVILLHSVVDYPLRTSAIAASSPEPPPELPSSSPQAATPRVNPRLASLTDAG